MQFTKVICCLDDIKNIYRVDTDKLYGASEPLMVFFSGLENSFRKVNYDYSNYFIKIFINLFS